MANTNFRKLTGQLAQEMGVQIDPKQVQAIAADLGFNPEDLTENQANRIRLTLKQQATGNTSAAPEPDQPNFLQQQAVKAAQQANVLAAQNAAALRREYPGMLAQHLLAPEGITEQFLATAMNQPVDQGFDLATMSFDPNDLGGMLQWTAPPQLQARSVAPQLNSSGANTSGNGQS